MTVRLILFSEKHLPASRRWLNNREISRLFNRVCRPLTAQSQRHWFNKIKKDKTQLIMAIEVDGVYVGNIGLKNIDKVNKKAEYYIFIGDKNYWSRGIGTVSTNNFLEYIKKNWKLHKIYLHVDESNLAARKLYQKVGFEIEGKLRDELYRDKKYLTMIRMAYFLKASK